MTTVAVQPTAEKRSRGILAAVFGTRRTTREIDVALVVVRVALAWIFFYYGTAKLFGWFNGAGLDGTATFFANTAHLHPGRFFAVLGGTLELVGSIAIAAGLASRLVAAALVADMVMAMITVTWQNGIHSLGPHQGYEINVAMAALALVVVIVGAGRFSLDALAEQRIAPAESAVTAVG